MSQADKPSVRTHRGDAPLVAIGAKYALPERFSATVQPPEPDLPICHLGIVVEDGHPVCESLRLERRSGGQGIGSTLLRRVPVPEYVRLAVDQLGELLLQTPDSAGPLRWVVDGEPDAAVISEPFDEDRVAISMAALTRTPGYEAAARPPRRIGAVTEETLREVADVYRKARGKRQAPTQAVVDEWNVSRSTASRWVKKARQEGFLGPTRPRVAGG